MTGDARQQLGNTGPRRFGGPFSKPAQTPSAQAVEQPGTPQPEVTKDIVLDMLFEGPAKKLQAQEAFDKADRAYKVLFAKVTIEAFSKPLFPRKDGEGLRSAANEAEREVAVEEVVSTHPALISLAVEREAALRRVRFEADTFEAALSAVQLIMAS